MWVYRKPAIGELFKVFRAGAGAATERTEPIPGPAPLTGARGELYVAAKSAHSEDEDLTAYVGRLAERLDAGTGLPRAPRRPDIERALYRLIRDRMSEAEAASHLGELRAGRS